LKANAAPRNQSMRIHVLADANGAVRKLNNSRHLTLVTADDRSRPGITVANPAETYLQSLAAGSRRTMAQVLNLIANVVKPGATANTLNWSEVGYAQVSMVRAHLASRYAPNTANKCLAALRGVMRTTFRLGLIDSDALFRAIDVRRIGGGQVAKGRALDSHEIGRLIGACDQTSALGARNAAIIAVGFGCGLRRAELVGLDVADVLEGGKEIRVRGKGNKQRVAYLPDGTQTHLAAWLRLRGRQEGPLFCRVGLTSARRQRLAEQTIYDVLKALAAKAGIGRVAPHDLRRTFVSSLLDQGVSLSTVAAMAGHSNVSTTAGYDLRGERAKQAASRMLQVAMKGQS